jgi:hypothetical protein
LSASCAIGLSAIFRNVQRTALAAELSVYLDAQQIP